MAAHPVTTSASMPQANWSLVRKLTGSTPILTYHDIIEKRDYKSLFFDCSVSELESQLTWLTKHGAKFITIDQVYDHLTKGTTLPKNAIAITFADGYEGFYLRGLPVLRRLHVPVAMFIHTDYVGDQHGRPKMTWEQIQKLDKEGLVTICSQTRTHPADITQLSDVRLKEELAGSKKILEQKLGHPIRFLAYPNGKFDTRVAKSAKLAGYAMAFTERLTPSEKSPNRYMVSRYLHTKYRLAWSDAGRS